MDYFLGFDVGTNSSKGTIINEKGEVLYTASVAHTFENPKPGYFEQDAEKIWWGDLCRLSRLLLAHDDLKKTSIAGVGVSALGCDVVPVDRNCVPLRKAILYGIDARGMETASELAALCSIKEPFVSSDCAPKIYWLRKNEPEVWKQAAYFLTASSYLTAKLTGEYVIDDFLTSSFRPLYTDEGDLNRDPGVSFICRPSQLARPLKTTDTAGYISPEASGQTGIPAGVPVVTGTDDSAAEAISSGVVSCGDFMVQLGSTAFMIYCTSSPVNIPMLSSSRYLVPGIYSVDGGTNTAGNLTRWIRDNLFSDFAEAEKKGGENAYSLLAERAAGISPGSDGVIILPYFAGERVPINDPFAKGAIFGLLMNHSRDHIYRAALEAVAYSIDQFIALLRQHKLPVSSLICTGGGSLNSTWMQIIADVSGCTVQKPQYSIGASYGDALISAIGSGAISDFQALKQIIKLEKSYSPDPDTYGIYKIRKQQFQKLYQDNKEFMHTLS